MDTTTVPGKIMSDHDVIAKVIGGEVSAFEILIRRFNTVLYKIGRMYGFNHHDTEDLMQDTHVAAYMQLSSFEGRSSYKTWISRIMINKCIYKQKYGYFKNEVPSEHIPDNGGNVSGNLNLNQTEKLMLNKELSVVLENSLERLPLIYRTVFILREIEGFSIAETADLSGITPVNVKVRLNRAKALLQKQLEQIYSSSELYSFNLIYCDRIVEKTFEKIRSFSTL
jgi:RNA polymerase sigma factor (sigma-70 family)